MRRIPIKKWKEPVSDGKGQTVMQEVGTVRALTMILNGVPPEDMPRGLENFRLFTRLSAAFEKGEREGTLELEDNDYNFLRRIIENNIPASWGASKDLVEAVGSFLDAKEE
jgi:hypothetical protein